MEARGSARWGETWRRGRALRRREEWDDDRVKELREEGVINRGASHPTW